MAQAVARQRFGFQRFPVVTAVVFAVTATVSVLGLALPSLLATLERAPAGLHGAWLAGYAWQPHGAGNSVAVCGLAGALVVALLAGSPVPRLVPMVLLYWCGALLSVRWGAGPLVVGIA